MATVGAVNGTLLLLYEAGVAIAGTTSHSYSREMETREATTKDSAGNAEFLEGLKSGTVDFELLTAFDAVKGYEEMHALLEARTKAVWKISTEVVGDPRYSFNGYVTSLGMDAGLEETMTSSGSIQITGVITTATVT